MQPLRGKETIVRATYVGNSPFDQPCDPRTESFGMQLFRGKETIVRATHATDFPCDHPGAPRSWGDARARRTIHPTPKALDSKAQGQRSGAAAERHPGDEFTDKHIPRRGLTRGYER